MHILLIFLNMTSQIHMLIRVGLFSGHHLVLDIQLMCSSLGKTISPALNFPQLPIVLCIGLRPHRLLVWHIRWCPPCRAHDWAV